MKDIYAKYAKIKKFRSRAAFKLIQINRKFNILEKVNSLLDLCCAPGSWLQVVHKLKTNKILLMGIDIVPIKKIKDVKFYKKNILLLKTIKNLKDRWKIINIEVILNDGSPNTGVSKILDTINQNNLAKHGIFFSINLLKKKGVYVCKFFISKHISFFLFILRIFFSKIHIFKPSASRISSIETYIIAKNFNYLIVKKESIIKKLYKFLKFDISLVGYLNNYKCNTSALYHKKFESSQICWKIIRNSLEI